jgi:hypothetical protein
MAMRCAALGAKRDRLRTARGAARRDRRRDPRGGGERRRHLVQRPRGRERGRLLRGRRGPAGAGDRLVNNAAANFLAPQRTSSRRGGSTPSSRRTSTARSSARSWCGKRWIERGTSGVVLSIVDHLRRVRERVRAPERGLEGRDRGDDEVARGGVGDVRHPAQLPSPPAPSPPRARGAARPGRGDGESMAKRVPLQRFGEPEELSNLAVFLLSGRRAISRASASCSTGARPGLRRPVQRLHQAAARGGPPGDGDDARRLVTARLATAPPEGDPTWPDRRPVLSPRPACTPV